MLAVAPPPTGAATLLPEWQEKRECIICHEENRPVNIYLNDLQSRVVALPCNEAHHAHLACYITNYAESKSQGQTCPTCKKQYDIIDPVIFAHLQPKFNETKEERRLRICQIFNISPPHITSLTENDLMTLISMLLCGDDSLFSTEAEEGTPRAELKMLIGDLQIIQDPVTRRQHLEELCMKAFYVERLAGETTASFHVRLNLFAKREARTSQEEGNAARMLAEAVQLNGNQPFSRRYPRDAILPPGAKLPPPLPQPPTPPQDDNRFSDRFPSFYCPYKAVDECIFVICVILVLAVIIFIIKCIGKLLCPQYFEDFNYCCNN